jgi:presenilin 1
MSDQTPAATNGRPPIHVVTRDEFEAVADVIMPVVYPVTIAMALCVALVNLLHTPGVESAGTGGMTTAVYAEKASDSASVKLEGAMANAAVFIAFITAATFVLFLLFKYRLAKVIWAYMGFSGLLIFGLLGGNILLQVLDKLEIAVDMISVYLFLWNFSAGGALMTFFWPGPLVVKQGYLIFISTIVSYYFTQIPEWTTWTLLVAMALYDLYAVLTPNGPLKMIVELAQERDEDIPALVYESRGAPDAGLRRRRTSAREPAESRASEATSEMSPLIQDRSPASDDGDSRFRLPDSIKLGLGDFIFYSVLVGRAAMYSPITCLCCFTSVLFGLVITLLGLGLYGKALPALPVSIALGTLSFFGARFYLEPFVVDLYAHGIFII